MNDLTQYLKSAFENKESGNYKQAIDCFYKALAIDNNCIEIMRELACLYAKIHQYNRSISFYEQILLKDNQNLDVKFEYAEILLKTGSLEQSKKILSELYESNYQIEKTLETLFHLFIKNNEYENIISYFNMHSNQLNKSSIFFYVAQAYSQINKPDLAEEFYKKAYYADKNNIDSGVKMAELLLEEQNYTEAENIVQNLLQNTEDDRLFYLLAEISYLKGKIDSAIKYYSYAIQLNPQPSQYFFKLAIIFSLKGFFKESEDCYGKAISIDPENELYNYSLAYLYYTNKKFDLSEKLVNYILSINPENFQAISLKTMLLIEKNDIPCAGKMLKKLNQQKDKNDSLYYINALYYIKLNLKENAIENLKIAISLNEQSIEYKYELAKLYFETSNYKESLEECNTILEKYPKYINAFILRAKIYLQEANYQACEENINIILNLDKNIPESYFLQGCVYLLTNLYEKAIEYFKIAVSMNPNNVNFYEKIAECYFILGKYNDAYLYYKEAAGIDMINSEFRFLMGQCCEFENKFEDAAVNYSLAKRLSPLNVNYIKTYAAFLCKKENKPAAVSMVKNSIKQLPKERKAELKKFIKELK